MTMTKANGIELYVERHGPESGKPLLLIRGLGSQIIHWPDRLIDGLVAQGFHVIAFDNRDVGLSQKFKDFGLPDFNAEPIKAAYSLKDMADDSIGLLDTLGIEKAHVLGISMGGMILQNICAFYPERLLSATIVMSSSGTKDTPEFTDEAREMLELQPEDPNDKQQVIALTLKTDRFFGSPGFPFKDEERAQLIERAFDRSHSPDGVARQYAAILTAPDRADMLASIDLPVLVIHGGDDALLPPAHGKDIAAKIPNAKYVEIAGMGHDLEGEIPDLIIAELTSFLS